MYNLKRKLDDEVMLHDRCITFIFSLMFGSCTGRLWKWPWYSKPIVN